MRLKWAERAIDDLVAIAEYIGRNNRGAAREWVGQLRERARIAAEHPHAGRMVPEIGRESIREILHKSYRIVYLVGENEVTVLTVFEGHSLLDGEAVTGGIG